MRSFLSVLQVILAIFVMLAVLLQTPKASGLGGTIGGGGDVGGGYRRRRGIERRLVQAAVVLVIIWVLVSVAIIYLGRST